MTPKMIYTAGPYSGPWWKRMANILRAVKAAVGIMRKGHIPICPHSNTCWFWVYGWGTSWEEYMRISIAQVKACDCLLYLGPSKGADLELEVAMRAGKVIFTSVDQIPAATVVYEYADELYGPDTPL